MTVKKRIHRYAKCILIIALSGSLCWIYSNQGTLLSSSRNLANNDLHIQNQVINCLALDTNSVCSISIPAFSQIQHYVEKQRNKPLMDKKYDIKRMETIHRQRYEHLQKACKQYGGQIKNKFTKAEIKGQMMVHVNKNHSSMYCIIEKTGSTLLLRIYQVLSGLSSVDNPFEIIPGAPLRRLRKVQDIPEDQVAHFLRSATKFLFVRDPYERLYSGYLDKLYSPNVYFWQWYGIYIISMTRTNPGFRSLKCGHDVTFKEFVKYVIHAEESNVKRNGHFTTMYDHCHPCDLGFNTIGKVETFKEDIFYILDILGESKLKEFLHEHFNTYAKHDMIRQEVEFLYNTQTLYRGCMTFREAQKRMWNKFKMRGIIKLMSAFPSSDKMPEFLTRQQFENYVYLHLVDKEESILNKKRWLSETYSTVDKDDLEKLSQIFSPDCILFQYDCHPDYLFYR